MFVVWNFVELGCLHNRNAPIVMVKDHNSQTLAAPESAPSSRSDPVFAEQVELANQ